MSALRPFGAYRCSNQRGAVSTKFDVMRRDRNVASADVRCSAFVSDVTPILSSSSSENPTSKKERTDEAEAIFRRADHRHLEGAKAGPAALAAELEKQWAGLNPAFASSALPRDDYGWSGCR